MAKKPTMFHHEDEDAEVSIMEIKMSRMQFHVLGTTPIILNRLSEKAKHALLFPSEKKNAAERAGTMKHDPLQEYRDSPLRDRREDGPTRLILPCGAFKGCLKDVALDIPGAAKSQVGRLTSIVETDISLFGTPMMSMMMVRSSNQQRTPDVRTRAICPEWACRVTVSYVSSIIRQSNILNLLGAAGVIIGVGDGRPQKGTFSFGQFELVSADNPDWNRIVREQGRSVQDAALEAPGFYDQETEDLYNWFVEECKTRKAKKDQGDSMGGKKPRGRKKSNGDMGIPFTQ